MSNFQPQYGSRVDADPVCLRIRLGRREIVIRRNFHRRGWDTPRLLSCRAGPDAGRVELSLCSRWLLILSGTRAVR